MSEKDETLPPVKMVVETEAIPDQGSPRTGWVVTEQLGDDAGDQYKAYRRDDFPQDCYGSRGVGYHPVKRRTGWAMILILERYYGRPWDTAFYYALSAFSPTMIRVIKPGVGITLDAQTGRITVFLDDDNNVKRVEKECAVALPDGVAHGHALMRIMSGAVPINDSGVHINLPSHEGRSEG